MIELLDYDIFHIQEGIRKDSQLCNIVNDEEFASEHMKNIGDTWCLFTFGGNCEKVDTVSKTKEIPIKRKSGRLFWKTIPKTITDNLKEKTYIKSGQMCPICYEPILSRKNSMILNCGHVFHKHCLQDWFLTCMRSYDNIIYDVSIWRECVCPLCRGDPGEYCGDDNHDCCIGNDSYNYKGERELADKYHLIYTCYPIHKWRRENK